MEVRNAICQHDLLIEREATTARFHEAELDEFRGLLRRNAQENVAKVRARPEGTQGPR